MKIKNLTNVFFTCFLMSLSTLPESLQAKDIPLPVKWTEGFPRLLTTPDSKKGTRKMIMKQEWAGKIYDQIKARTDSYLAIIEKQPDWLYSRLQMYWTTHATDVYINAETYDHAGGKAAPEPTLRYVGTRGMAATFARPALKDVVPYDDNKNGEVTFHDLSLPGRPLRLTHPSKTGGGIGSINREIMGIARDAAFMYWITDDQRYAQMAAKVFDVYMAGLYYRNVPIDLAHGHQQTLVGMNTFEVIHEDIVEELTQLYDFLHDYLKAHYGKRMDMYVSAFKKEADLIIANGVPHNNWDLFQAMFVQKIATVLDDNDAYKDKKGRQYYLDYLLNKSSIRQWSLQKLADFGFDPLTHIWSESPGYSSNVVCDYADIATSFDNSFGINLIGEMPVIGKAVATMPQYLFPNRMICGFGDTHPGYMRTSGLVRMIQNAQKYKLPAQEKMYTEMLKCIDPSVSASRGKRQLRPSVNSLFAEKEFQVNPSIPAGKIEQYVSPLFYSPKVSWLAQRNGMDKQHSLMISLNGSRGNHQHANGISMELYGKGYVLGPDAGIGRWLYSGLDYQEYYSQFPAHNTVCVDGVSSYPVMMSQHAFELRSGFPQPAAASDSAFFSPITYSEVYFREPESQSDQVRTNGIVTVDSIGGYYVDIFRSRKVAGGDKMHDYFYHNLGQNMQLTAADGSELGLKPTEELAFAGGHLYAYSYIYNKFSATTTKDVKAIFRTTLKDSTNIDMTMWMKGDKNREVFEALSPVNREYERMPHEPYNIEKQPVLTFIARQKGEAWNHPFVAVFEPSTTSEPSKIQNVSYFQATGNDKKAVASFAGICVKLKTGRTDYIFSSAEPSSTLTYQKIKMAGTYALVNDSTFFLGNGTLLSTPQVQITADKPVSVYLTQGKDGQWTVHTTGNCKITADGKQIR